MPKKRVSAYWNFVKFYARSKRASGFNLSLEVADREASQIWTRMQDHEKQVFAETSEVPFHQHPGGSGASSAGPPRNQRPKMDSRQRRYLKSLEKQRLDYVEGIENFEQHVFCLAHVRDAKSSGIAAEITIVRWSIERGIITYFHVVCDPEISGDEYKNFRRRVGDKETIVRILNSTRSAENRERVRDALMEFCGGAPLLVRTDDLHQTISSMNCFNSNAGPVFTVMSAQEVLQTLSQRIQNFRLMRDHISAAFDRLHGSTRLQHLKCNLHRELGQFECSLEIGLSMAYALEEIFAPQFRVRQEPISHHALPGVRPQGVHYSGTGINEEDEDFDSW